jgi:general secretion pathway protein H
MGPQVAKVMMPTSITGRSNSQAGFTLIELVLVVLLLGLLTSLTLPMLSGLEPDQLNVTARRLSGTVKYLYNEAAMTGREHRLIFELPNGSYRAVKLSPSGELQTLQGLGAEYKLRPGVRFMDIYQPQRGQRSDGEVTTTLMPGGWLQETIIHLQDDNERKLTLRLVPLTGLTEIYDGYRDLR